MFILDTDHLVIAQRSAEPEASRLRKRMAQHDQVDFYLSVISVHEQMREPISLSPRRWHVNFI